MAFQPGARGPGNIPGRAKQMLSQILGQGNSNLIPSPTRSALVQQLLAESQQSGGSKSPIESLNIASKPILAAILGRREERGRQNQQRTTEGRRTALAGQLSRAGREGTEGEAARMAALVTSGGLPDDPTAQQTLLQGVQRAFPEQADTPTPSPLRRLQLERQRLVANGIPETSKQIQQIDARIGIETTRSPQEELSITVPGPNGPIQITQGAGGGAGGRGNDNINTIADSQQQYNDILGVIQSTNENPGGVGMRGAIGERVGGLLGGAGLESAGDSAQAFISGADPQVIQRQRLNNAAVVAQNMREVLAEQSSRLSETERDIANGIIRIAMATTSPSQIKGAAAGLMELKMITDSRARIEEEVPQLWDMGNPEVRGDLITQWRESGLSDELIGKMLTNIAKAQGLD